MNAHTVPETTCGGTDPRVVLLRNPPAERSISMARYADHVQRGLKDSGNWNVAPMALMRSRGDWPRGTRLLGSYWDRLVAYPVAASRRAGDLWHVCDHSYAHLAALLPPERTIVTCHDLMLLRAREDDIGFRGTWTSTARFRWTTSFLRKVAHVMCDSSATREDVIRLTGAQPARTSVVPLGVAERFQPLGPQGRRRQRLELGYCDHSLVILNVSSGQPYKNPLASVECLAELRTRGVDAQLLRVGPATLPEDVRRRAQELNVGPMIRELGAVSEKQLVELYNSADVLLHPSFWEGFGWPPLEAMACGTPPIVSTVPSLIEVVGDAGLAAAPTDIRGLVGAILRVTHPSDVCEWRRRAMERARRFQWGSTIRAIEQTYRQVLDSANTGSLVR